MYADVMNRTQVYLSDSETTLLDREAHRTGASRSELIRRAVHCQYDRRTAGARLAQLRATAGIWHDRPSTGAEYVDDLRGDLDERLDQLGLS